MPTTQRLTAVTAVGLFISLFGLAFFTIWYRDWFGITIQSVVIREALIFLLVGIVLWIIKQEGLTIESVGLRFTSIGKSLGYGMLIVVFSVAGVALCIVAMQFLGWKLGGNEADAYKDIPVWVLFIMVIRAGIAEELFYRGYAIERLTTLTGSRWIAIATPLIIFSGGSFSARPGRHRHLICRRRHLDRHLLLEERSPRQHDSTFHG